MMLILKRKLFLVIILLYNCNFLFSQKEQVNTQFIIMANTGMSNFSIGSLIISIDTVFSIEYPNGNYDMYVKYGRYTNVVVDKTFYEKLLFYLSQYQSCKERPDKFISEEKNTFIIDYRDETGKECRLLSVQSLDAVLFIIKNIFCFIQNYNQPFLLECLDWVYKFYINTYDRDGMYKQKIFCY